MSTAELLKLVELVNAATTLAAQFGLSMQHIAQLQARAQAEGRPFGLEDVQQAADEADAALQRLRDAINEASAS